MPRLLHSDYERFGVWKNYGLTCVWTRKFDDRIHGIETEQRHEFHFVFVFANEQFRAAIAADVSRGDARENLVTQQFLVRLGVFWFRPSMPNARDHDRVGGEQRKRN